MYLVDQVPNLLKLFCRRIFRSSVTALPTQQGRTSPGPERGPRCGTGRGPRRGLRRGPGSGGQRVAHERPPGRALGEPLGRGVALRHHPRARQEAQLGRRCV